MSKLIDLTGRVFGRLTVMHFAGRKQGRTMWACRCACGLDTPPKAGKDLRSGHSTSCGCRQREEAAKSGRASATHGQSQRTREYETWKGMNQRCRNPNCHQWKHYGRLGITVSERWQKFENFLADLGPRPTGTSLGRLVDRGNYAPGNAFWQTREEQELNKRNNRALLKWEATLQKPVVEQ